MIPLIFDNAALANYCQRIAASTLLAVDTEFIRQSTLLPKLGLIQLFDGEHLALVDPLTITDWQPLIDVFANENMVKMLHSCHEDIEAFATIGITDITPLFDSQLAAHLLGWGSSVGFASLVERITNKVVDKSETRTDWLARPLADKQLTYAANDVLFLYPLYQTLKQELNSEQSALLLQEGQQLMQRKHQKLPFEFKYLEIKNSWLLTSRELAVLRELVRWRAEYAQQKDLALGLVFKDAQLFELAKRRPSTLESLMNIPDMPHRELRRHGKMVIELIERAKALPADACPQRFHHQEHFIGYKQEVAAVSAAVKKAATEQGISAEFLSVKRQLNEYINWCWRVSDQQRSTLPVPEYLKGWRRQVLLPYLPVPEHIAV
ncbi:ribonuclease D [Rheinheimera sp. WS51]|uniref:ribonuclease D n=1 Tax=Rheinheimera sp. WS51 TaxID=3425886 RepID=UPI003D90EED6